MQGLYHQKKEGLFHLAPAPMYLGIRSLAVTQTIGKIQSLECPILDAITPTV